MKVLASFEVCFLYKERALDYGTQLSYIEKNNAAGTRLRKVYLEIKNLAAEGRTEVQQLKNEK